MKDLATANTAQSLLSENTSYQTVLDNEDVSDWFVKCLMAAGIEQVFGLPGAAIEPLYNALGRAKRAMNPAPSIVTVKHEAAAAYAAEGYYNVTGKIAMCCTTAGPGATNLITGLASAKLERTPMLIVTGQTKIKDFSRGAFQDSSRTGISTVSLLAEVCSYSCMITHPDQLPHKLYAALTIAMGPNPGPVHLSIPLDIFRTPLNEISTSLPSLNAFVKSLPHQQQLMSKETFVKIITLIEKNAKDVSLIVGPGCKNAADNFMDLADAFNWNLMATPNAKGLVDHERQCFKGIIGFGGHGYAYEHLINTKGPIFLLGTPFDEASTGGWDTNQLPFDRVIQIDSNAENLFTYLPVTMRCLADINDFASRLKEALFELHAVDRTAPRLRQGARPEYISDRHWHWIAAESSPSQYIKPQEFIWTLNQLAGPATPLCADSSSPFMWSIHLWQSKPLKRIANHNNFHLAMTLATMGWAVGGSIGVAQALKMNDDYTPTLCITGDGSYLMSSLEIGTAVQQGLNIAFFVLNNGSYGIVEHCQRLVGAEEIAFKLPDVDYSKIAEAFGVPGFRVRNKADLAAAWDIFMQTSGPALFDILIDPQELPPLGHRLESLGFAGKK